MKLPRNSKLLRSPVDAAPFAAVFFLLVIFLILAALLPTPGLELNLQPPLANILPGTDQPTVAMAVDAGGRYYFENQIVTREKLGGFLRAARTKNPGPLTLVIHADRQVTYEELVQITMLARTVGITNDLLATLPGDGETKQPLP